MFARRKYEGMNKINCDKCKHEIKFGEHKTIASCERGSYGLFHSFCYLESKGEL